MQSIASSFSYVLIDAQTHTHTIHTPPALIHPLIAPRILPTCLSVSLLVRPPSKIATPTPTPTPMHTHSQRTEVIPTWSHVDALPRSLSPSLWCNPKTAALLNTPRQPLSPLPLSPTNRTRQTDKQARESVGREALKHFSDRWTDGRTERRRGNAVRCVL